MSFNPSNCTTNFGFEDGFQTTLSAPMTDSETTASLTVLPTPTEGTLVIEPGTSNEEEIYYTSKGTGLVNIPSVSAGRGVNGAAKAHNSGVAVKMLITKASLDALKYGAGLLDGGIATAKIADAAITQAKLEANLKAGWNLLIASGTRVSNTSMTVTGDMTAILAVGDKLKVTDTTTKYFYLTAVSYSSPNTTITFTGGTDHVLAGNPTNIYYSKMATPVGFPQWFNFNETGIFYGASGSAGSYAQTIYFYKFRITGNCCEIRPSVYVSNKGSWSGDVYMKVPVPSTEANDQGIGGVYLVPNNTTFGNGGSVGGTGSGNSYLKFGWNIGTSNMAWSNIATTAFSGGSAYYTIT